MEPSLDDSSRQPVEEAADLAKLASLAATALGRDDLVRRIRVAQARLDRPDTVIAVVGEFKQGKSSLINGLLGQEVCPVDDDIATSTLTVISHGEEPRLVAWVREGDKRVPRELPVASLPIVATERGMPAGQRIDLVEVFLPNPLLARGISLVDTPGANGLRPGYAAVTLGYLQTVHAAIFVSDASSPLSHEESAFLREAGAVSPTTLFALTKIDLFPHWREILAIDQAGMRAQGLDIQAVPISSTIRAAALQLNDRVLNNESGFPDLIEKLDRQVVRRTAAVAALALFDASALSLTEMRIALDAEIQAREAPETVSDRLQALDEARSRLERLRQGSARWTTTMNDGLADVVSGVDYRFRRRMRDLQRYVDDEIERGDPRRTWPELTVQVRERAAEAARDVIREMEAGTDEVAGRITAMLAEEDLQVESALGSRDTLNVGNYWAPRPLSMPSLSSTVGLGFSGLRGAQGGLILFSMMAGIAGFPLSAGALLGAAAIFGGKQLIDERKRQLTQRRQQARASIRQFLDETEFEVGRTLRDLSRDMSRRLRDHYSERIAERLRTCTVTAEGLQRALEEDEAARNAQLQSLGQRTREIEEILNRIAAHRAELLPEKAGV